MSSPSEQFRVAVRGERSAPRRVRCLNPFRWLEVGDGGEVTPCCAPWFKGSLGSLNEQTLAKIWNDERMREVREAMYEGGDWERYCNAATCPNIINDTWFSVDFIEPGIPDIAPVTAEMLGEVREGHTVMESGPAQIGLACDARCNLKCIMCTSLKNERRAEGGKVIGRALESVSELLPSLRRIKMMGDGEVFAIPEARDFLFNFDSAKHPDVEFILYTNGQMLTSDLWEKIAHLNIYWLIVSVDAARKETYEKIRRGGSWEKLMANLEFIAERFREGRKGEFFINMCVMKSNHREMLEFAELGKRLGAGLYFLPILGDVGEEQIFDRRDIPCLRRVAEQLRHPSLTGPKIDLSPLGPWREWHPTLRDYLGYSKRRIFSR